jgi:hypothetical protein
LLDWLQRGVTATRMATTSRNERRTSPVTIAQPDRVSESGSRNRTVPLRLGEERRCILWLKYGSSGTDGQDRSVHLLTKSWCLHGVCSHDKSADSRMTEAPLSPHTGSGVGSQPSRSGGPCSETTTCVT